MPSSLALGSSNFIGIDIYLPYPVRDYVVKVTTDLLNFYLVVFDSKSYYFMHVKIFSILTNNVFLFNDKIFLVVDEYKSYSLLGDFV